MSPLEDPRNVLLLLADVFNYYQLRLKDNDSPSKKDLIGRKGDIAVAQFFPDLLTINDKQEGIKLDILFQCATPTTTKLDFQKYGLNTELKEGRIYFASSTIIIEQVCNLLATITRKQPGPSLLQLSSIQSERGRTAIQRKLLFEYGKLFDTSPFNQDHLCMSEKRIKTEIVIIDTKKEVFDEKPAEIIYSCRGKWNDDVLALFLRKSFKIEI